MSDVPWIIISSKRKPNRPTSTPCKRTKREHSSTTTNNEGTTSRPQPTLTQIAFVTHSSIDDEESPIEFEPLPAGSPSSSADRPARTLKRDSTLTQMDFGSSFGSTGKRHSLSMQPPTRKPKKRSKKRNSTLTQMDFFNGNMNGANELEETMLSSPKLASPKPQKTAHDFLASRRASVTPVRDLRQDPIPSPDTQDYQPGKRKRKEDNVQSDSGKRRRSSRIAAATSTPETPASFVLTETIRPASSSRRTPATTSKRRLLEIQDSTDFLEESTENSALLSTGKTVAPSTPTKNIGRIPSSQTPESIRRDTPSHRLSAKNYSARKPLAELSSNLRMPGQTIAHHKPRMVDRLGNSPSKKSAPRKVCTLKVRREALVSMAESYGEKVLEHDIYSIQATSSPTGQGSSPQKQGTYATRPAKRNNSSSGPTIKETASSQRRVETQESLPDISDVLNLARAETNEEVDKDEACSPVKPVLEPSRTSSIPGKEVTNTDKVSVDRAPTNMIPELEQVPPDDMSDFGSPVANDTQFIRNLHERLSSPVASATSLTGGHRAATVPRTSNRSPLLPRGPSRASMSGSPPKRSPLPAPKLVQTSSAMKPPRQATASSSLRALPSFSTQNRSFENVQISLVPLNDTAEYLQSSSSPALPPVPLSSESANTRLASIPHPSQVSTQAPSQGFFPTSSAPQTFPFPQDSEVERITVKDSSSYAARLSQLVQHVDENSESEGDLDLLEELHGDDDLDLDPSTAPVHGTRMKQESVQDSAFDDADLTQTPTQRSRRRKTPGLTHSSTQSSPIITNATTRSQRNARLEVIPLTSSSSPSRPPNHPIMNDDTTPRPSKSTSTPTKSTSPKGKNKALTNESPPSSSLASSSAYSPSPPRDLKRKYTPIPGFNNDTQSDFTQNGSVTAAYVHRMWDRGDLPRSFVPKPYKVKNFTPRLRKGGGSKRKE